MELITLIIAIIALSLVILLFMHTLVSGARKKKRELLALMGVKIISKKERLNKPGQGYVYIYQTYFQTTDQKLFKTLKLAYGHQRALLHKRDLR